MTGASGAAESPRESAAPAAGGFPIMTPDEFKAAFRHHPGGVSLVTAEGPGGPVAMTATSVASVSAEPPLLVFSVSTLSSSHATLTAVDTVVVHLLDARHRHLARLGATSGIDRFEDTSLWSPLATGEPVFHGTRWIRARIVSRLEAGTATLVVAQALQSDLSAGVDDGLVYVDRAWHRLGAGSVLD